MRQAENRIIDDEEEWKRREGIDYYRALLKIYFTLNTRVVTYMYLHTSRPWFWVSELINLLPLLWLSSCADEIIYFLRRNNTLFYRIIWMTIWVLVAKITCFIILACYSFGKYVYTVIHVKSCAFCVALWERLNIIWYSQCALKCEMSKMYETSLFWRENNQVRKYTLVSFEWETTFHHSMNYLDPIIMSIYYLIISASKLPAIGRMKERQLSLSSRTWAKHYHSLVMQAD